MPPLPQAFDFQFCRLESVHGVRIHDRIGRIPPRHPEKNPRHGHDDPLHEREHFIRREGHTSQATEDRELFPHFEHPPCRE
mgnify:CR=1 FL=1